MPIYTGWGFDSIQGARYMTVKVTQNAVRLTHLCGLVKQKTGVGEMGNRKPHSRFEFACGLGKPRDGDGLSIVMAASVAVLLYFAHPL
jgi:hypothetical protein